MLCGLLLFKFCILNKLFVSVISACSCTWKFEQCFDATVFIPYEFYRYSIKLKFAPWFQTAGLGVFAGRPFEKDVLVPASWKTLFLPKNFPNSEALCNYPFEYNKTHNGLVLDYASIFNHHESANVKAGEAVPGSNNVYFQVRMGFQYANRNVLKICSIQCMHTYTHIHNRDTNT